MKKGLSPSPLPSGWRWTLLGEVCSPPQYGFTTSGSSTGDVKLLRTTDITSGRIEWDSVPYCKDNPKEIDKYILKDGDIVVSRAGSVGVSMLLEKPQRSVFASYLIRFRPFDTVAFRKFFYLFLKSPFYWNEITEKSLGIALQNVNASKLKEIRIPLPPLPEQHRIVEKIEALFSELENGIEQLKTAQQQLKVYRQSVLKWAFEGKLTAEWRRNVILSGTKWSEESASKLAAEPSARYGVQRESDSSSRQEAAGLRMTSAQELLARIRHDREAQAKASGKKLKPIAPLTEKELAELPELPEGWAWVRLDNLGELARGKSKHRPRNEARLFGGRYPFVQTGEVKAAGHTIRTFENTYSEIGLAQSRLWPKGTLCITIAANIAETAFLGFDGCFPDSIVGFTANDNLIVAEFIFYFFKANQSKLESFAPATAQKNINLHTLENLVIPYCSSEEQYQIVQEIESRLSVCDKLEETITASLQQSEALRQSILKKGFEGKLVAQDPKDEPASVLLEKIRTDKQNNPGQARRAEMIIDQTKKRQNQTPKE
jgi:type I restriction enzyme S subunit